jgi:uncharacterized membrane protein
MLPPIVLLHVSGGVIGLVSGAVALSFRKGSRAHRVAGNVFFISMLIAAAAGTYLGFRNSEMDNFFGGILVIYLLATARVTARRRDGETGIFDWVGFLVALAVGFVSVTYAIEAAHSPTGTKDGLPPSGYWFPISVALLAAAGDAHMLWCGGLFGAQRIARHLWRMCCGLFIASASIFLARPQLFPALLSKTHILFVLGILPLVFMAFWLGRILFTNAFKRTNPPYRTREAHGGFRKQVSPA